MVDDCWDLPPGFRFHPTDEEIITHYVMQKIINHCYTARAIGEVDLNKCEPWDLPSTDASLPPQAFHALYLSLLLSGSKILVHACCVVLC